jgi:hypothetical protein
MQGRTRKAAAVGATAFVLAGSAALATPGTASAETITAGCGDTVTASPGDKVSTPFGLQTITDGLTSLVGGLLGTLCKVTVNVVDTVVAPVPVVGEPVAGAVNGAVSGTTNTVSGVVSGAGDALSGGKKEQPAPQNPSSPGGSTQNPGAGPANGGQTGIPSPNSPVLPGDPASSGVPSFNLSTGYAPMRDYSGIPFAVSALWAPSPGLRYGGQIPGYAPQVGSLEQQQSKPQPGPGRPAEVVQNAGQAVALPGSAPSESSVGLPMLIAVLALSGVSAALVRAWVLRGNDA